MNGSPGINVTVYFPPNLVGLNMSDCTVAMPRQPISQTQSTECFVSYSVPLEGQRAIVKSRAEGTEKAICGQRCILLGMISMGEYTCEAFVELRESMARPVKGLGRKGP